MEIIKGRKMILTERQKLSLQLCAFFGFFIVLAPPCFYVEGHKVVRGVSFAFTSPYDEGNESSRWWIDWVSYAAIIIGSFVTASAIAFWVGFWKDEDKIIRTFEEAFWHGDGNVVWFLSPEKTAAPVGDQPTEISSPTGQPLPQNHPST